MLALLATFTIAACSNSSNEFSTVVSKHQYQGDWPFSYDSVKIICSNGTAFIEHEGRRYGGGNYSSGIHDPVPSMNLLAAYEAEFNVVDALLTFQMHLSKTCNTHGKNS